MFRLKTILLLLAFTALAQMLTAFRPAWLPVYLHAPKNLLRPLLTTGVTAGLLTFLLKWGKRLPRSEYLLLLISTAGSLANLVDLLRLGAVLDFIPVVSRVLVSPGDLLLFAGFLIFLPLSFRNTLRGQGLGSLEFNWWRRTRN